MPIGRTAVVLMLAIASLAPGGCKIVRIADEAAAPKAEDIGARAAALWSEKAAAHFQTTAKPMAEVLAAIRSDLAAAGGQFGYRPAAEGSPWTFVVSGSGTVKEKNTTSRAGTLVVTLDGTTPPVDAVVQIGPVIRGNAVRDSLPFLSFEDFENQIDFADMGKALIGQALKAVEPTTATAAPGAKVAFVGVISLTSANDKILVTPVSMKAGE